VTDLRAAEVGDDTAYGQALFPVPSADPNDPLSQPISTLLPLNSHLIYNKHRLVPPQKVNYSFHLRRLFVPWQCCDYWAFCETDEASGSSLLANARESHRCTSPSGPKNLVLHPTSRPAWCRTPTWPLASGHSSWCPPSSNLAADQSCSVAWPFSLSS
jgi:hypothetical protein